MAATGKFLMKLVGAIFGVLLVVSMVLGYSGSARLAGIGNTVFAASLILACPMLIVGLILFLVGRGEARHSPPRQVPDQRAAPVVPPPEPPVGAPPPSGEALRLRLTDLGALLESGGITQTEHDALRQRALDTYARGLDT